MPTNIQSQWFGGPKGDFGDEISQSLRFPNTGGAATAYLSNSSLNWTGNQTYTISYWLKKAFAGGTASMSIDPFSNDTSAGGTPGPNIHHTASGGLSMYSGSGFARTYSDNPHFRDTNAWYHFVHSRNASGWDTWVNGVYLGTAQISNLNGAGGTHIMNPWGGGQNQAGSYLAEYHVVDGQHLQATEFGRYNEDGIWVPKTYTGTYGTKGFYLNFDSSQANGVGHDSSGNNNHFAATGFDQHSNDVKVYFPVTGTAATAALGTTLRGITPNGNGGTNIAVSSTNHMDVDFGRLATFHTLTLSSGGGGVTIYVSPDGTANSWISSNVTNGNFTNGQIIAATNGSAFRYLRFTCSNYGVGQVSAPVGGKDSDIDYLDTPTNNVATLNPLVRQYNTLSNANLTWTQSTPNDQYFTVAGMRMDVPTYGEFTALTNINGTYPGWGICNEFKAVNVYQGTYIGGAGIATDTNSVHMTRSGTVIDKGTYSYPAGMPTWVAGDCVRWTFNPNNGECRVAVNGGSFFTWHTFTTDELEVEGYKYWCAAACNTSASVNFGNRPFVYPIPAGFKALEVKSLGEPTIKNGKKHMTTLTWVGDGTNGRNITGAEFQPDLVWIKSHATGNQWNVYDSIRGVHKTLQLDTDYSQSNLANSLTAFNSDGIQVGTGASDNTSGYSYVGYCWKAGGVPTTVNTNAAGAAQTAGSVKVNDANGSFAHGTIAVQRMSVNTDAGFSMVEYDPPGSAGSIPHGLGAVPEFAIFKRYEAPNGYGWDVYHKDVGNQNKLQIDVASPASTIGSSTAHWNNTTPTDTVFTIGAAGPNNTAGGKIMAWIWRPIPGYSSFGDFQGNANADGPFIYLGFQPQFILIKNNSANNNWALIDTARDPFNDAIDAHVLYPDSYSAEGGGYGFDILSNGFKCKSTSGEFNGAGHHMVYAAFAEHPFGGENMPPLTAF